MIRNFEKFLEETEDMFLTDRNYGKKCPDHETLLKRICSISDDTEKVKRMIQYDLVFNSIVFSEYSFLNKNEHLYDNIVFIGFGGSHSYGTNIEGSDVDIRGCALNKPSDILLPGTGFEQYVSNETDTTIYSFNKLISLICNCNPNTIELLGLKPEHYIVMTDIGREIIDKKDLFLSKKAVHSFGGYASQQLYRLNQLTSRKIPQPDMEKHILNSVRNAEETVRRSVSKYDDDNLKLYIDDSDSEDMEKEIFIDCNFSHYRLRDYCTIYNTLKNVTSEYGRLGKRNKHAETRGKISKHAMHLVRLYYMCFDILEKHEINTYRENEHDLLMSIRNGKYSSEDGTMIPEFFEIVDELEKRFKYAKENTDLPENPDYNKINEFVMDINSRVVSGKV